MATARSQVQELVDQARESSNGISRVPSTEVVDNGTLYAAINKTFAENIGLSGGEEMEKYASEDGRVMVLFFPEEESDE